MNTTDKTFQLGRINEKSIIWRIISRNKDQALLLCEGIVDSLRYNDTNCAITWEQSSIRKWLNTSFLTECFTNEERLYLCECRVKNENNPYNGTTGGNDTNDVFFLLSIDEVNEFLPKYYDRSIGPQWWLRTPGDYNNKAMYIGSDGQRQYFGYYAEAEMGIRPAVWIKA